MVVEESRKKYYINFIRGASVSMMLGIMIILGLRMEVIDFPLVLGLIVILQMFQATLPEEKEKVK